MSGVSEAPEMRRRDAEDFALTVGRLLTTLDVLPTDQQQRALDILKAAYPDRRDVKPSQPDPYAAFRQLGGSISGSGILK